MSALLSSLHTAKIASLCDGCIFHFYSAATSCKEIYMYSHNVRAYRDSQSGGDL